MCKCSGACSLPVQRQFSIPQRKEGGHWHDFEVVRRELQPFLHPVQPPSHSHNQCMHPASLPLDHTQLPTSKGNSIDNGVHQSNNENDPLSSSQNGTGTTAAGVTVRGCSKQLKGREGGKAVGSSQAQPNGSSGGGNGGQHRMPTQQELNAAGRMDLLNAMRVWGGFTAVADRMGVLPNTRYTAAPRAWHDKNSEKGQGLCC